MGHRVRLAGLVVALMVAAPAAADWTQLWRVVIPRARFGDLAVAADGTTYWAGMQRRATFLRRFSDTGEGRGKRRVPATLRALALSTDGAGLAAGGRKDDGGVPLPWLAWYTTAKLRQAWSTTLPKYPNGTVEAVGLAPHRQGIYVAGSYAPNASTDVRHVFVARLTMDGAVTWATTFERDLWDEASTLVVDPRGKGVLVGGRAGSSESAFSRSLLLVYGANGLLQWMDIQTAGLGHSAITALALSRSGRKLWAAGYRDDDPAGEPRRRWYLQQFNSSNGVRRPAMDYDMTVGGPEAPARMVRSADGKTFYLAGYGCLTATSGCEAYLLKLDARGRMQDRLAFSFPGAAGTSAGGVALGVDGAPVWGGDLVGSAKVWIRAMDGGGTGRSRP